MTEASDTPKKPRKKTERHHLTKSYVESLSVPGEYHDDQLKGFLVRVSLDKGVVRRTYRVRVKPRGKGQIKAVTYTIGHHGDPWIFSDARERANELKMMIKAGINPTAENDARVKLEKEAIEKERLRKDFTLRVALDDYLKYKSGGDDRKQNGRLAKSTAASYIHYMQNCLGDWLDKPMVEIDEDMVLASYRLICDSSKANANNTFRILSTIFNWHIKKDRGKTLVTNPVSVLAALAQWVKIEPRKKKIPDSELSTWWLAVENLKNPDHRDYLKMLLLTGLRRNELATMLWADVDFKGRSWTVRNTKNGRDHSLPFTNYVASILGHRVDQCGSGVYVFPGRSPGSHMFSPVRSQKLIEQAGVKFHPHMLRVTFSTISSKLSTVYEHKRFMNHHNSQDVTQHHYTDLDDVDDLRENLQAVEDRILKLCTAGSETEKVEAASRRSG